MSAQLYALGRWCFRNSWKVIGLWIALLALVGTSGLLLMSDFDDEFRIPGSSSQEALDKLQMTFPEGAALSANAIYRQDGSALTYQGLPVAEVPGRPSAAVTGGDGLDYVLLGGQLVRVSDGRVLDPLGGPFLTVTPGGVRVTSHPAVETTSGTYWLRNGRLERVDAAGTVLAGVPHEAGLVGVVGEDIMTVTGGGHLRRFTADLRELPRNP